MVVNDQSLRTKKKSNHCCYNESSLIFESKHDGIFSCAELEIHDPLILLSIWSVYCFKMPAPIHARITKFFCHPFQDILHLAVAVRCGFVSHNVRERGELRHSPMSRLEPAPGAALGVGL